MRKRIIRIKSELVSSPDVKVQRQLRQVHELEQQGHTFDLPVKTRPKNAWYVSNQRGYDAHLTVGEGTLS